MPKWAFRVDAAPLGSEEPSVTLKLRRMTVAEMNIFRPYSSSQPFWVSGQTQRATTRLGQAGCSFGRGCQVVIYSRHKAISAILSSPRCSFVLCAKVPSISRDMTSFPPWSAIRNAGRKRRSNGKKYHGTGTITTSATKKKGTGVTLPSCACCGREPRHGDYK